MNSTSPLRYLLLGLVIGGCGVAAYYGIRSWWTTDKPQQSRPEIGAAEERGKAPPVPLPEVRFTDVTDKAGLRFTHVNGAAGRKLLPETMGSGVAVPLAQILPGGTAYQTDAGACADYDSVIGMDKAEPLQRFTRKLSSQRFAPATGPATLCGVFVATGAKGLATRIAPVRVGGRLAQAVPEL